MHTMNNHNKYKGHTNAVLAKVRPPKDRVWVQYTEKDYKTLRTKHASEIVKLQLGVDGDPTPFSRFPHDGVPLSHRRSRREYRLCVRSASTTSLLVTTNAFS